MLKKFLNIFFFLSFSFFVFLITNFYFSDINIKKTNKSRSFYDEQITHELKNLPLLSNDTMDIIEYKDDVEIFKKRKKKYKFFDLLKD